MASFRAGQNQNITAESTSGGSSGIAARDANETNTSIGRAAANNIGKEAGHHASYKKEVTVESADSGNETEEEKDDAEECGGGVLRVKDLQSVFSSSLVSTASLEFLSIANVIEEDYADIK